MYIPTSVGVIIGTCTKSASTSLANQHRVPGTKRLTNLAVIELKKCGWSCIGLVRDPIERLESAYNFFQYGQCGRFPNGAEYTSIGHFVDSVLNGHIDAHWAPQSEQLILCDNFVDLESYPLDRTENRTKHLEVVKYRIDELGRYYAGDYAIRGNQWQS